MEKFITEPATEEQDQHNQASKLKNLKDPFDNFDPNNSDLCLADSFLDFDSIKEFFEDSSPNPDRIGLEKIGFGFVEKSVKMGEEEKSHYGNVISHGSDPIFDGSGCMVKAEVGLGCEKEKNLRSCIEEEMEKVSLVGLKGEIVSDGNESKKDGGLGPVPVEGSGVKSEIVSNERDSDSDSESESENESESSTSSSSASSSSDDDDDDGEEDEDEEEKNETKKEVKRELNVPVELEEGEIEGVEGEGMVGGIDDDDDDDDGDDNDEVDEEDEEKIHGGDEVDIDEVGGGAMEGPIRSKNELQVLPPVPQVNVTLQPHHQMLPVGVVLSVFGVQVIVEGIEKHDPLNDGSILWLTESRSPLGLIDELFGPVKNPYYVVRYNSESDMPAGINIGAPISFVQEFANHVLNDKNLYKKGYDASGENDEELSDEAEFSDDEKEAEYRRKLKMEKRGPNDQIQGNRKNNRKKVKNKDGAWRNGRHSFPQMDGVGQPQRNEHQHHVSSVPASLDSFNSSMNSSGGQGFVGGTGLVPQLQQMAQNTGFATSSNGVWTNGMSSQQLQSAFFPNGFSTNGLLWPSQNYQQQPYRPVMNSGLFMQQFDTSQISLPNVVLPGGQSNFFAGPAYAPWQGLVGQNDLSQAIGQGLPGQLSSVHAGQGILPGQNNLQQAAVLPGSIEAPQQFNMGASSRRGRRPYHRGGRFDGGRGRHHQSK